MYIMFIYCPLSMAEVQLSKACISYRVVDHPFIKPYCLSHIRILSLKKSVICFLIIFSKHLHTTIVKLAGLQLLAVVLLPFLNIADICPSF